MNHQLQWITGILDENGVKYWIDGGTLLGIIRDGELIEGDGDIDISVFPSEIKKLEKFEKVIKESGYSLRILKYGDKIFKVKYTPHDNSLRKLDFSVFRTISNGSVWCPQPHLKTSKSILAKLVIILLNYVWIKFMTVVSVDAFPWKYMNTQLTWLTPGIFINQTIIHEKFNIPVPEGYKDYLRYRYGNWEKPADSWSFLRDDGGLFHRDPQQVIKEQSIVN
jgi:hypothetical protein